jgi:hypothetical protein
MCIYIGCAVFVAGELGVCTDVDPYEEPLNIFQLRLPSIETAWNWLRGKGLNAESKFFVGLFLVLYGVYQVAMVSGLIA